MATQADADALGVKLAVLLKACAREKAGLVEAVDAFNAAIPKPKRRWPWGR